MITAMRRTTPAPGHPQPRSWRLTPDFLVEQNGRELRYWGRWDRRFGCWDGAGTPLSPAGPLLGCLGTWADPPGERDPAWYAGRAAIAAYWSLVPTPVRLIAAGQGEHQWPTLLRLWLRRTAATGKPAEGPAHCRR
jgi:hypothetical protein